MVFGRIYTKLLMMVTAGGSAICLGEGVAFNIYFIMCIV